MKNFQIRLVTIYQMYPIEFSCLYPVYDYRSHSIVSEFINPISIRITYP